MAAELVLAPEDERDVAEAYAWYGSRRPGLGGEFPSCLEACLQAIQRMPLMHAAVHENYRRGVLRRFPYAVFYEHAGNVVLVFAVFHASRDPAKWRERLTLPPP